MRSLNIKRTVDFTKGPITKPLLLFALPVFRRSTMKVPE